MIETTTTVAAERGIPADSLLYYCNLDGVATNTSQIVRLHVDHGTPLRTTIQQNMYPEAAVTRSTWVTEWSDPSADIVSATVEAVLASRTGDPRGDTPPPVGSIALVQRLMGSMLPDLWASGETVIAAIGPWGVEGEPAWRLHAAAVERDDGSLQFLGPCADAFTDDLGKVADQRQVAADASLVAMIVQHQLEPGASADLRYAIDGFGWGGGEALPPSLVGHVRVTGVVYVRQGVDQGTIFVRSGHVTSAAATTTASDQPFALPVLLVDGVPIELVMALGPEVTDSSSAPVVATLDPALLDNDSGLVAEFDTVSGTATLRSVGFDEFGALARMDPAGLRPLKAQYEAGLVADTTVPEPERYGDMQFMR